MKIYPDPDLPDLRVDWGLEDCRDNTPEVAVTLRGLDDAASTRTVTVACTDLKVTVADVARERFHVEGALIDAGGMPFITADGGDVDLRNGFNASAGLYFDAFSNFQLAWTFSTGSCDSIGATSVGIVFSTATEPGLDAHVTGCLFPQYSGHANPGVYTVQVRAFTEDQQVVAVSPESTPFEITENGFRNLGTFVLTPCGAACN